MTVRASIFYSQIKMRQIAFASHQHSCCNLIINMYYPDNMISFENIHKMNNRAMPEAFMKYKIAIQLHKLYNATIPSLDRISLNLDQILTTRQTKFLILKSNKHKVGLNTLPNRFSVLNGLIPLPWLSLKIDTYKIHIKKLLF